MAESKKMTTTEILKVIYANQPLVKKTKICDWLELTNAFLVGPTKSVKLVFDAKLGSAYTYVNCKDKRVIKIGGNLIKQILGLEKEIDLAEIKDKLPYIKCTMVALDYHEIAHNLYTDMISKDIVGYPKKEYINFFHGLFNTFEDCHIEIRLAADYAAKRPREKFQPEFCFNFIIQRLFKEKAEKYEDDGTLTSFMNYLLLILRLTKKGVKNKNAVWEKYQADMLPMISDILTDEDGTSRLHKTIAFGEWMIENVKEFEEEFKYMAEPERKVSGSLKSTDSFPEDPTGDPGPGIPKSEKKKAAEAKVKKDLDKILKSLEEEEKEEEEEDKSSGSKSESEEDKDGSAEEAEDMGSESDGEEGEDKDGDKDSEKEILDDYGDDEPCEEIVDSFEGDLPSEADHEFIMAKEVYEYDDEVIDELIESVKPYRDTINSVAKVINLLKARKAPRDLTGFRTGKLDMPKVIKSLRGGGTDTKVFKKPQPVGTLPSVAFSELADNSGSMGGEKSRICSIATLAVAQVADKTHTPCEVSCFTKDRDGHLGGNITIIQKEFDEPLDKALPYFAINDSDLIDHLDSDYYVPTFHGNTEEINLFHVWQRLRKRPEKHKILFVICDGETTGDEERLKKTIDYIEAVDKIMVIGIGVMCRTVARIYNHYKLFNSTEELEAGLAPYLIDTLTKYIVK